MKDADSPDRVAGSGTVDPVPHDPDAHSTWNTLDGTVEIDEVLDEDDLKDFLVEPIPDPLAAPDTP